MKSSMRKIISGLLAIGMILGILGGCSDAVAKKDGKQIHLSVFAAASLTETLTEIAEEYRKDCPYVTIDFNFDSSGTLRTQITEGAECDLFISAAQKQMNQLDAECPDVSEGDYLLAGSRIDLLENKVVLVSDELDSFAEMAEKLQGGDILLCIGNSDVPAGQYARKIFDYLGLDEEELAASGRITYGSNVKEITTQVAEGLVDCGIVYATDACSAGLRVAESASPEMCGKVVYPAAILKGTKNEEEAKEFLEFLQGETASEIFESVGFLALSK